MKTNFCDYHMHTEASDGRYDADTVIEMAKMNGITSMCITDHDVVYTEAAAQMRRHDVEIIPGVEFNCIDELDDVLHKIHVIGWNIRPQDPFIQQTMQRHKQVDRRSYLNAILDKLEVVTGVRMTVQELIERFPHSGCLGRQHIAQLMTEKGIVCEPEEAFQRYIGGHGDRLAYVENPPHSRDDCASMEDVIAAIHHAQGLAILCHLYYYRLADAPCIQLLRHFKDQGGDALECDYGHYDEATQRRLFELAGKDQFDLCPSAGSDFHGYGDRSFKLGAPWIAEGLKQCWMQRYHAATFQNQSLAE